MRNRWGVEIKKGYHAWATWGNSRVPIDGTISRIDRTSDFARAYGAQVTLENSRGEYTIGADEISEVLPPMRVGRGGVVKANPILKQSAGEFDAYGKHRWFGESSNEWAVKQGFPYELESVSIHGNAPLALSKTRAYVMVDEDENGPVVETWPIRNLRFFSGTPQIGGWTRKANPAEIHIDIGSHNTKGRNVRAKNPDFTVSDFRRELKAGPYAWPGGYPRYFVMSDGEALSFKDAKENARQIMEAIRDRDNSGWRVVGVDVNWEDPELYSAHSGERIESAYSENPTPRLTRYDQPSQRERISERTGRATKTPSARLKNRRLKTHHFAPEGVWANPITRVKLKSPAQRSGADPSPRLLKRRRVTAKAPPGFYANPVARNSDRYAVQRQKGSRWDTLELFDNREFALIFARAYANAHPTATIRVWDYGK